jgi:molybdenum cofactor cytidylyltransferase
VPSAIAAVILAAGASRRLGRPKQLLEIEGRTLVRRIAEAARAAGFAPLFAVVGAGAAGVWREVSDLAVRVDNPAYEEGVASSIRAGIEAVERSARESPGALLLAVDQPYVDAALLHRVRSWFDEASATRAVACTYSDTLGIPALFPRSLFAELRALRGDRGAKAILAAQGDDLLAVPFLGGEIDLDTEADVARLATRADRPQS